MTCKLCTEDYCSHYEDVRAKIKTIPGFEDYQLENLKCPICISLISEPMVMENGSLIDYSCLKQAYDQMGEFRQQQVVKFAVPSVFARDEIARLLKLTYGSELMLPPCRSVLKAPGRVRPRPQETWDELVERRRLRVDVTVSEVRPTRPANWDAATRAERLMPRNQNVEFDEFDPRPFETPVRHYQTVTEEHLTPHNLFMPTRAHTAFHMQDHPQDQDSEDTIDLTAGLAAPFTTPMTSPHQYTPRSTSDEE